MNDVGSPQLTRSEVAQLLKVTERTVYGWEKKGLLHRINEEGPARYDRTYVLQLEKARQESSSLETKYELINHRYRIQHLEKMMKTVEILLDMRRSPLRPDPSSISILVEAASGPMRLDQVPYWADLFLRMDEIFFAEVQAATKREDGWMVFYRLCLSLQAYLYKDPRFSTNLELQELHSLLDKGRQNLRSTILLHISSGGAEELHEKLFGSEASPKEDILRRLS